MRKHKRFSDVLSAIYLNKKGRQITVNKAELVSAIAEKCEVTKAFSEEMLNATCEIIMDHVAAGDEIKLVGFGRLAPVDRAPRVATVFGGKQIKIPAKKAVVFIASERFKKMLNPPKKKKLGASRKKNKP